MVKLYLQGPSRPSPELEDTLDYSKSDDQIVGCLHKFHQDNQGADARLLTHDGGPMMTAKSLGIPYVAVKDDWLLAPENNENEKENARLKERIAQLERAEPQFNIDLVESEGGGLERLEFEHQIYDPLPEDTVKSLMDMLMEQFPQATHFGSREPAPNIDNLTVADLATVRTVYIPPKQEEIDQYSNEDYPKWLEECKEALTVLHEKLQSEVINLEFTFTISNVGNRPGNSALVNIVAKGDLQIYVAEYVPETEESSLMKPVLPPTPPPPPLRGRRSSILNALERSMSLRHLLRDPFQPASLPSRADQRRDANAFYYKPNRPTIPSHSITLECEQWRHSTGPEHFFGLISVDPTAEEIRGALICQVHAENLSEPVKKLIPVRITITRASSEERAKDLVEKLDFDPRKRVEYGQ